MVTMSLASNHPIIDTRQVTGIYSNLFNNNGDIRGMEALILYAGSTPYVVLQIAQGATGIPFTMPATIERQKAPITATLEFTVPKEQGEWGKFHGTIDSKGLKGVFEGNHVSVELPRNKSYWQ
jgi:hypothetical protein